jgi:ParB/RepB/Spo0J family partition protein
METISLDKIICESNRKYTKDEGFEQLLNSIRQYGIIEPPIVRVMEGGLYRTIAGRRRIAAAKQLGKAEVDCVVRGADDPINDEEIALTENVNRQDMHPLDEAAAFRRMAEEGNAVEEIARYYARSPSAIYKRLRLVPLIEELKGWFRDQILDISGAALLAELPEEDQKKFYEEHEATFIEVPPEDIDETCRIGHQTISQFIYKHQRNKIKKCLGDECQACEKRTHNSSNDLFEEFSHMDDVCLDGDCYRAKWQKAINLALEEKIAEYGPHKTDKKIYFKSQFNGGIPEQLYKRKTHAIFSNDEGLHVEYEILKEKDWEFTGETGRKNGACWEIGEMYGEDRIRIRRIGYKEKKKEERASPQSGAGSGQDKDEIKRYGPALKAVAMERGTSAEEMAKELQGKRVEGYDFTNKTEELVYERVVARRIEAEKTGAEPPRDYMSMFMRLVNEELYSGNSFIEENFNDRQKQWYSDLVGKKTLKKFSLGLPEEAQMLFHFMMLCIGFENDVPGLNDLKGIEKSPSLFWEYAGMDADEYRALYTQAAKEVVAKELEPKPKKAGKKKEAADTGPHGGDAPEDASGSPPSKPRKGGKRHGKKDDIRRCRVCGCTDDDCSQCIEKTGEPCHWVEDDLCSACVDEEDPEIDNAEDEDAA